MTNIYEEDGGKVGLTFEKFQTGKVVEPLTLTTYESELYVSVKPAVINEQIKTSADWHKVTDFAELLTNIRSILANAELTMEEINAIKEAAEAVIDQIKADAEAEEKKMEDALDAFKAVVASIIQAEAERKSEEQKRATEENARKSAEQLRNEEEQKRVSEEQSRKAVEQQRVETEQLRNEEWAHQKTDITATAKIANDAARDALEAKTQTEEATANANVAATNANNKAEYAKAEGDKIAPAIAGMQQIFTTKEDARQQTFEASEAERKAIFDSKEAERDAAVAEATKVAGKVDNIEEDFAKYENRPDVSLTPIVSGKYINSEGKYVDAAGWAVAEIGAIEKGLRYKLYMKDSSEMVLGAALFVSRVRTFDDKGEVIRTTLTPIFSARDTNIPTHGKVVLKAWDDYADVLVCYKPALTDKIEVSCYGGDKSDATQMKNLKDDIDRKASKAGRHLDLVSGMTLAFEPTKDGDTTAYDERLTAGRNVNFAPELTERVPDEENKSYSITFDGMRGECVGGNQSAEFKTGVYNGTTLSYSNGTYTISGTPSANIDIYNTFPNIGKKLIIVGCGFDDELYFYESVTSGKYHKNDFGLILTPLKGTYDIISRAGTVLDNRNFHVAILDLTTLFPTDSTFVANLTENDAIKALHRLSFFSYEQNMETLEITENVYDTIALGAEVISKMGYQNPRLTFGSHGRIHLIDGKDGKTIKGTIDMRAAKRAAWAQVLEQLAAQGVDTSLPFMADPFEMSINDQVGIKWDSKGVTVNAWVVDLGSLHWGYNSANKLYNTPTTALGAAIRSNVVAIGYNNAMLLGGGNDPDMTIFCTAGQMYLTNSNYTSASAFKTAMQGQYLVYQLATPIRVDFEDMALNLGFADVQSDDFFGVDDMDGNHMYSIDVQYETREGVQYKKVRISPNAEWVAEHGQLPTDIMTSVLGFGFTANYATMLQMYKDIQQLKNR